MTTLVVGDGPTGLTAALLLAKNGVDVDVFGDDQTRMHGAYLYNYPGIEEIDGSDFVQIVREQCASMGATLRDERVTAVEVNHGGFTITTDPGETYEGTYLILAVGKDRRLARSLSLEFDRGGSESAGSIGDVLSQGTIRVDRNGRTSEENVYAGGWAADEEKVQAAIAVGDGARIAMDIVSREAGEPVLDFDVPP